MASQKSTLGLSSPPSFWGLNVLRIGAGITMLYMHGINHTLAAWQSMWNHVTWNVPQALQESGLPYPNQLAIASAAILIWTCVSWILGFAVRFSSAVFLPLAVGSLLVANNFSLSGHAEASILYIFVALTLLINGAGLISVDALFNMSKRSSSSPKRR